MTPMQQILRLVSKLHMPVLTSEPRQWFSFNEETEMPAHGPKGNPHGKAPKTKKGGKK